MDKVKDLWYSKDTETILENKLLIMLDLNKEELEEY
jgi:hypothetical protein